LPAHVSVENADTRELILADCAGADGAAGGSLPRLAFSLAACARSIWNLVWLPRVWCQGAVVLRTQPRL